MRNIAYILAFLLVCPTLLFATQTDDCLLYTSDAADEL